MSNLTSKQLEVIDDLFESGGDETATLKKHNISRKDWQQWLADKDFTDKIAARLEASKRQSRIILSKYIPLAAAKLVQLCDSENHQTALKACLDILSLQTGAGQDSETAGSVEPAPTIDPATASKILTALAQDKPSPQD